MCILWRYLLYLGRLDACLLLELFGSSLNENWGPCTKFEVRILGKRPFQREKGKPSLYFIRATAVSAPVILLFNSGIDLKHREKTLSDSFRVFSYIPGLRQGCFCAWSLENILDFWKTHTEHISSSISYSDAARNGSVTRRSPALWLWRGERPVHYGYELSLLLAANKLAQLFSSHAPTNVLLRYNTTNE